MIQVLFVCTCLPDGVDGGGRPGMVHTGSDASVIQGISPIIPIIHDVVILGFQNIYYTHVVLFGILEQTIQGPLLCYRVPCCICHPSEGHFPDPPSYCLPLALILCLPALRPAPSSPLCCPSPPCPSAPRPELPGGVEAGLSKALLAQETRSPQPAVHGLTARPTSHPRCPRCLK